MSEQADTIDQTPGPELRGDVRALLELVAERLSPDRTDGPLHGRSRRRTGEDVDPPGADQGHRPGAVLSKESQVAEDCPACERPYVWGDYHVPQCRAMSRLRSGYLTSDGVFTGEMGAALFAAVRRPARELKP